MKPRFVNACRNPNNNSDLKSLSLAISAPPISRPRRVAPTPSHLLAQPTSVSESPAPRRRNAELSVRVRVEHDVLRGGQERHGERERGEEEGRLFRRNRPHAGDREQQRSLRGEKPPASPAEQRDAVAVHQRRPQELVDVRLADEREPADRLDVDALDRQPGLQRGAGERERKARGEAQQKKKKDPLAAKNRNQSA